MGIIFNEASGERVVFRSEHVFGRSKLRADTRIALANISSTHALIRWRKSGWFICDSSRNGTWLDSKLLVSGRWYPLALSQIIHFDADQSCAWQVQDISAPRTSLIAIDPTREPLILSRNQILPNDCEPECSIFQRSDGVWTHEQEGRLSSLSEGDLVTVQGQKYRFMMVENVDDTSEGRGWFNSSMPRLSFEVSSDEEDVRLKVAAGDKLVDLGERCHHYCLLTLARQRLRDSSLNVAPRDQGWLNRCELASMLRLEAPHLNIQIYRARHQLMASLPEVQQLSDIIERRRGGIRWGELSFEIKRGSRIEGAFDPYRPRGVFPASSALQGSTSHSFL